MANVENVRFILNQPFLTKLEQLIEEKFSFSSNERVLNVIEIGCGPGDFALIFKDKFKDRVQVTAIDPSETDITAAKAKSTGNDVDFQHSDIFKFTTDKKFDLVMFTKSLHHCIPVDQAVKNAYDLLAEDGIFLAEEIYLDRMYDSDTLWFFDRLDLIIAAGCMKPAEEGEGHHARRLAKMLDTSLPTSERWIRPPQHGEGHKHHHGEGHSHHHHGEAHSHGEGHHHGEAHSHGEDHKHHHGHDHTDHQKPRDEIVGSSAVVSAITAQFGEQKMTLEEVPYFYQLLTYCG
ncbi:S-adenosyl-L-methionine-dependent methyltransferase [Helicostylum pulchrum]|nr:S-adenosyl-L-methionine-dependent methyltransferase [Helicostylum pulchrum]